MLAGIQVDHLYHLSQALTILQHFLACTREDIGKGIACDQFPPSLTEGAGVCKFVGTSVGVDAVSSVRKMLGAVTNPISDSSA
jgi:hypothetical protein